MQDFTPQSARRLCVGCAHFSVTWDRRAPYGCGAFGFKSKMTPSLVVYETSGIKCQLFTKKKKREGGRLTR